MRPSALNCLPSWGSYPPLVAMSPMRVVQRVTHRLRCIYRNIPGPALAHHVPGCRANDTSIHTTALHAFFCTMSSSCVSVVSTLCCTTCAIHLSCMYRRDLTATMCSRRRETQEAVRAGLGPLTAQTGKRLGECREGKASSWSLSPSSLAALVDPLSLLSAVPPLPFFPYTRPRPPPWPHTTRPHPTAWSVPITASGRRLARARSGLSSKVCPRLRVSYPPRARPRSTWGAQVWF